MRGMHPLHKNYALLGLAVLARAKEDTNVTATCDCNRNPDCGLCKGTGRYYEYRYDVYQFAKNSPVFDLYVEAARSGLTETEKFEAGAFRRELIQACDLRREEGMQ